MAADAASSIAELATNAVTVLANVGLVVAALAGIISFIAGIISFFTGKSKQQKEAEKRRDEAEKKAEKARKRVEDRLVIVDLSIALPKVDEVEVSWKPLEENVKYSVRLTRIDLGGKETTLLETTTENNKVNFKSDAVKYNTEKFMTSVQASYHSGGKTFTGNGQSLTKNVTPLLHAPSKLEVESKQEGREVHVTFSQVEYAKDYKAEVITHDHSVIGSAIIKPPPDKDGNHVFHADKLDCGVPGKTQVRICARGHDESLNDFKYSTDLYMVAAPSDILHSYEPTSQQLSVQWNVKDVKNISNYFCEVHSIEANTVVFSKEVARSVGDSLESSLKIHLNEISDKTKSPYRIVVCSLGVSATVASVFVNSSGNLSFLPQVDGISPSYDPQSNQLTVSWVLVTGATKYNITIREKASISSVVRNLTSDGEKNKVVFEMGSIPLQSGVKYIVTVVAEGSDALHLPSLPSSADTEFAQLPKPASVSQDYSFEEKKIDVTFQPVPDASAHLIEVFNEITPTKIAGKHVVPKATGVDWPSTATYSFDVDNMKFNGGARFKSRVIAQGNAHWMNSSPCLSSTAFTCSDAAISVALKYSVESNTMIIVISSKPGHFSAKIEDTSHKGRTISTQQFLVKRETGKDSVHQTLLEIPLTLDKEPRGAIYQAFVLNTGDQQHLPSEVKQSNEVPLLDPPASVSQEYKDGVFTVAWKCVQSAISYHIRVYNTKTGSTASEVSVTRDVRPAGEQMKKEFDVDSIILESDGLYQTLVTVLGDEVNIGGASTKSNTNIASFPSPEDVKLTFNNETRHMLVRCSSVKGAVSIKLGVVDADKLKHDKTNIQGALLGFKEVVVTSSNDSKPIEVEFDDSVLIKSLDGLHRGVAQLMEKHAEVSLPSGYSISDDVVAWLKPPVPIHIYFEPEHSTLKITWTPVNLAIRYLVEILQKREDKDGTTTLIPFSDEVPADALSCNVNMENVNVDESDTFIAKVQPDGNPGTVITLNSTGYSNETLVCENSPTDVEVLQVEDETVRVAWKGDSANTFQFSVWRMSRSGNQEGVFSKQIDTLQLISTSKALRMISPGRYRFGVRAQGSINKLHSVYTHSDVSAVIMDAPNVITMKQRPAVTVEWIPIENNPTQNFSNYVIHYLQRGAESEWKQVQVEISAKEKTIEDLQPDSDYLFCISVVSSKRGNGIRSSATAVRTESDARLPGNLLDNPNFVPVEGWDEHGYSYNIITHPWQIIQPTNRQYRLENTRQGTAHWPDYYGNYSRWRVAAANLGRRSCWRVQMIDLLAKGFTPEYLDEMKPDIEVYEWFAIQSGGSGAYDIKVSLLDSNKKDLPGENFYLARDKVAANDGSWKRLGHTFSNYPSGLRFIRFEDGMQSLGLDVRAYDVKAFGATVKISKR